MMENHMNNYPLTKPREPSLLLDLQNNLIRIHRNTLSLLGNPEYIQILVNPDTALIAIRGCNKDDYRSERIRWDTLRDNNKSCEFYSKSLIKTIRKVFFNNIDTHKYRITGKYVNSENLTLFNINAHKIMQEDEEF